MHQYVAQTTAISHNVKENVLTWDYFFPSNGVELLQGTRVKWPNTVSTPNDLNIVVRLRTVLMETSTGDCTAQTLCPPIVCLVFGVDIALSWIII